MLKSNYFLLTGLLILGLSGSVYPFQNVQSADTTGFLKDWFLRDPETDKVQGLSVEKAYGTLLKGRPSRTITVAVIDSGIDFEHEDLKDVMWTNLREIAGNGLDDDKNGYIDDLHGWSFIGGKNGNVKRDTYELTREYARLRTKYENLSESNVLKKDKSEYAYWLKIKTAFTEAKEKNAADYKSCIETTDQYSQFYRGLSSAIEFVKTEYNVSVITARLVDTLQGGAKTRAAKSIFGFVYENQGRDADVDAFAKELKDVIDHNTEVCDNYKNGMEYGYNPEFDPRGIVGDNYTNTEERFYGNNDVKGTFPVHGTHVAGVIAANRKNDIGINGIADNVKIMALRAVPNGDERDKDVANAIRYAVDNGAKIVNMSFGKDYSPQKDAVDKAVKYAESKGVLLVHAAGNDDDNNDTSPSYPTRYYNDGKEASNWIEVGASAWGADSTLAADFSNYGKKSVNFFAPGVQLYSTTPANGYEAMDGTSFASPAVSGVAALLMSYFPNLTPLQVKDILIRSTRKFDDLMVRKSEKTGVVKFSELSSSGGIVNAYEAVKLALSIESKGPEK
jgi:subtilisin family serine protease